MNAKTTLILLAVIGMFFLGGCVATPYSGGAGNYRGATYSYGYRPAVYYSSQGYIGSYRYFGSGHRQSIGGHNHHHGGHRHSSGAQRHWGGHKHSGGGHHGGGHRGHRGHRR